MKNEKATVMSNECEISQKHHIIDSFYAILLFDRNDDSFYGWSFSFLLLPKFPFRVIILSILCIL